MGYGKYLFGSFQSRFVLLRRGLRWQPPRRSWSEQITNSQSSMPTGGSRTLVLAAVDVSKASQHEQKGTSGTMSFGVGAACTLAMTARAITIERKTYKHNHLSVV